MATLVACRARQKASRPTNSTLQFQEPASAGPLLEQHSRATAQPRTLHKMVNQSSPLPKTRFAVVAIIVVLCSGCGHMTVAPTTVQPHQISTWAQTNIVAADANGILVTSEFVRVYRNLLKVYGSKLPVSSQPASPDDGIAPEGKNFRISYVVQSRFAELKFIERTATTP